MLEKGWNQKLPEDTLRRDFLDLHPTTFSCKFICQKVKHNPKKSKNDFFNVMGFYAGPFVISALHGTNAVQVELSGKLANTRPTFLASFMESYQQAFKELFLLRKPTPLAIPPVKQN
ncbi:hypothetical protein O181_096391 [Austropuccinia psidii MF-1]|uniref:Uncharacterized protein n=1 Tax=Austropuccinia psidii MF-1 TaxID=1389203 RepID=A0A9Q3J6Z1_9BASI|nr:hypothetical protein [Austropuccinia psidii MF-1]